MNRLGIENISAFGLSPVEYVDLAADLGCANISLGLTQLNINPHGYAPWSLLEDAGLRRDTKAALKDRGVVVSLAEGLTVRPDVEARDRIREYDIFAELGARRVNVVSLDPDIERTFDQFAVAAELGAERGMVATTELAPGLTVDKLSKALDAVRHVGRPDFSLLIDTMHVIRSGATVADLAALDSQLFGYVQICDVPLVSTYDSYMEEAMTERLVPGDGELPLLDILRLVPPDRVVSIEVPLLARAKAGIGPHERLRPAVEATRALLARLG